MDNTEDYKIQLQAFEGPLDLLLHLIQKNEVNIYDIPIASITNQYLSYLKSMHQFNIEVASEFLVTAATLIAIKVKLLLPKTIDEETGEEEDPRLELVERLLEYERFKAASEVFKELIEDQGRSYFRPKDEDLFSELAKGINPLESVEPEYLLELMNFVLSRKVERTLKPYEVQTKQITINEKVLEILNALEQKEILYFDDVVDSDNKSDLVIGFLALLDLFHQEKIAMFQESNFKPVKIMKKVG